MATTVFAASIMIADRSNDKGVRMEVCLVVFVIDLLLEVDRFLL